MTDYIRQKLTAAVRSLALGTGTLKQRIESSYSSFKTLKSSDFSDPDDQRKFERIRDELTSVSAQGSGGSVKATLKQMRDADALRIATEIVDLAEKYQNESRA